MADYLTNTTELTAVADAIREKTGENGDLIYPNGFVSAIEGISGGGGGGATWTEQLSASVDAAGFDLTNYISSTSTVWCATIQDVCGKDVNGDSLSMGGAMGGAINPFKVYGEGNFSRTPCYGGATLLVDDVNGSLWYLDFATNGGTLMIVPALMDNGGMELIITGGIVTSFKTLG